MKKGKRQVEENQFLNVGLAIHPMVLTKFLNEHGVDFELSDY